MAGYGRGILEHSTKTDFYTSATEVSSRFNWQDLKLMRLFCSKGCDNPGGRECCKSDEFQFIGW